MTTLTELSDRQRNKSVTINENFEAVSPAGLFGIDHANTSALDLGIFGGRLWDGSADTLLADVTKALTASATNYVEATTAGVVSVNTSAFTAGRIKLYTITTTASGIDVVTDYRQFVLQRGKQVLAAMTSAELAAAVSDETGSGALVFAISPTLVTALLGTPTSGNLVNCTGYVGTSALVTTGALNSGSITSGFGSIDIGSDPLAAGPATFTGAQQDAAQQVARFQANNASGQLKAFDIRLTAGTPTVLLTTAATGTDPTLGFSVGGSAAQFLLSASGMTTTGDPLLNIGAGAFTSGSITSSGTVKPASYTVGTLPSAAAAGAGAIAWCSNETNGAVLVTSNGTNWKIAGTQTTAS